MKILGTLLLLLCMAGSLQAAHDLVPVAYKAEYQLTHEGKLVGRAFFTLSIGEKGTYKSEVYTVPDGEMFSRDATMEILEESRGHLTKNGIAPDHYAYKLRQADKDSTLEFIFDWKEKQFTAQHDVNKATSPLEVGTQDRLSYLLQIRHDLLNRKPESLFLIAEPGRAQLSRFLARSQKRLQLPAGRIMARKVERLEENTSRTELVLWYAKDYDQLPVLLEKQTATGEVRMELVSYKRL